MDNEWLILINTVVSTVAAVVTFIQEKRHRKEKKKGVKTKDFFPPTYRGQK